MHMEVIVNQKVHNAYVIIRTEKVEGKTRKDVIWMHANISDFDIYLFNCLLYHSLLLEDLV